MIVIATNSKRFCEFGELSDLSVFLDPQRGSEALMDYESSWPVVVLGYEDWGIRLIESRIYSDNGRSVKEKVDFSKGVGYILG